MPSPSWLKIKSKQSTRLPIDNFVGRYYNKDVRNSWIHFFPIEDKPIQYLEIGVADGGNLLTVAKSYAKHPESRLYAVDPWMDYDEYPEYKGMQDVYWNNFNTNLNNSGERLTKFSIHRGFSGDIVPRFPDNFFDIIFVDGNHETEYVYKDGIMALQKVKSGGYIVFDDYIDTWSQTMKGIDMFIEDHKGSIEVLNKGYYAQAFVRKL